jgi:hypothetical protein
MVAYILLLVIVFFLGFKLGKHLILKGLAHRVEQLHQEGDYRQARMIEEVLNQKR